MTKGNVEEEKRKIKNGKENRKTREKEREREKLTDLVFEELGKD